MSEKEDRTPAPVLSNWREIREECARVADDAERAAAIMLCDQPAATPDYLRSRGAESAANMIARCIRALPAPPGAGGDEDKDALSDRDAPSDEHSTLTLDAIRIARDRASRTSEEWWTVSGPALTLLADAAERVTFQPSDEVVETLHRLMDQVEKDFASAHAEIVKLQGGDPAKFSWPEWSPQANTLRWIADIRTKHPKATGGDTRGKATSEHPSAEDGGAR